MDFKFFKTPYHVFKIYIFDLKSFSVCLILIFSLYLIVLYKRSCQRNYLPRITTSSRGNYHPPLIAGAYCTIYQGTKAVPPAFKPLYLFCFLTIIGYYNLHLRTMAGLYCREYPYENFGTSRPLAFAIIHSDEPSIVMQHCTGASVDLLQVIASSLQEKK